MKRVIAGTLLIGILAVSCTMIAPDGTTTVNKTGTGAGVGAAAGAVLGQIIGKDTKGTLIGTALGTVIGTGVGALMDAQERQLKQKLAGTGVKVERTSESEIKLVASENITFDTSSSVVKSTFNPTLDKIAGVLKEFQNSTIIVGGHTDSTGTDAINNPLSTNRATAVKVELIGRGVQSSRIEAVGYGSKNPVASNNTVAGRAQNRRVEIKIVGTN